MLSSSMETIHQTGALGFTKTSSNALAIIGGRVSELDGKIFAHVSFGKIVEAFSSRYDHIYLSSPLKPYHSSEEDYQLPDNVTLFEQPNWKSTADSLRHLDGIKASYRQSITAADHIFIRGNPVAATTTLYSYCARYKKPVCHWLVGNPMSLLKSHKRSNFLKDAMGKLFVWQWERKLCKGRAIANGAFVCNGNEIAERYPSPRTFTTISTTLSHDDFFEREDTCQGDTINILCLCFIRPEKGVEYLIEAFSKLQVEGKKIKLLLAGSRDRYLAYQQKLDSLVNQFCLGDRVSWLGHIKYQDIPELMRRSDIFVLPTLSEGTPRVLVEARANSLPLVATNVGGIPTSVTNNYDGLLVPPKDAAAIANAISKLIEDPSLRKQFIKNGFDRTKELTTDSFVDQVISYFTVND